MPPTPMLLKRLLVMLLLLQQALPGHTQQQRHGSTTVRYSPTQLHADYSILRKALETTYPSLYRFADSTTITRYFIAQAKALDKPLTEVEFYKVVATTCARVNDEHIIPTPSKAYYESLKKSTHYFPFSLKIIDRRCYVLEVDASLQAIPRGAEILSINGRPVEAILSTLLPTIPSDGYIETFNIRHLEDYSMTQNESLFDLKYPIFVEEATSFRIEYIDPADKALIKVATVAGIDFDTYKTFYRKRLHYKAPLQFKMLNDRTAYLRISSFLKWHRDDFRQDFYALYDSIFTHLNARHVGNLILDLRNNEGGDGTGEKLLTYLITKPYRHFEAAEEKFVGYPAVAQYLENGNDLLFPDSIVYRTAHGMYRLRPEYHHYMPLLDLQQPNKNNYHGNLYVLMNGASGSMASVVSSILKENKRATFIGEESGGAMEGPTSLSYARLRLPNTKIGIEVPLTKCILATTYTKGRGVLPDYAVAPTIDDLLKGVDTELNFTLRLIAEKEGKAMFDRGEK